MIISARRSGPQDFEEEMKERERIERQARELEAEEIQRQEHGVPESRRGEPGSRAPWGVAGLHVGRRPRRPSTLEGARARGGSAVRGPFLCSEVRA